MKQALLLDDDATQLSVRQLLLRRGGIESQLATNPLQALTLLASEPGQAAIGAVITDHIMPVIDGAEFVRRLRTFDPHIPVIVVSGLLEAEDAYRGLNVSFLTKPCEPDDLIAMVKSALSDECARARA
jgi:CheY-like chemotaxis protein